jgi:hypothetical protein
MTVDHYRPREGMILSSSLTKQLHAFLSRMSTYGGIGLCLTDEALRPIVKTSEYHSDVRGDVSAFDNALTRLVALDKTVTLKLFGEKGATPLGNGQIESILDLAVDGIEYFIKNEAELQTLSEELLERYQELHVLYEAIEDVRAIFDEYKICEIILNKALQSVNAEFGAVVFADDGTLSIRQVEQGSKPTRAYAKSDCLPYADTVIKSGKHLVLEPTGGNVTSVLAVPITLTDSVFGAMVLMGKEHAEMFTSGDRITLGALAGYLGIAVTTTRLIVESREAEALRHEVAFAQKIQQSLLPASVPRFANLDIAAHCLPSAQVGGDLFGFQKLEDQRWAITVADVAGHGLGAAFIMASLRSILRSETRFGNTASDVLKRSNDVLGEDTRGNDVYATVFFALFSEKDNSLNFSNAGHPAPLFWQAASGRFGGLQEGGMALGLFQGEEYDDGTANLHPGDIIVIYTDGVTEAKNSEGTFFGEERLKQVIKDNARKTSQGLMEGLLSSLEEFQGGIHGRDDVTVLILKSGKQL